MEVKNATITIDDYISGFPKDTQKLLTTIRGTIKKAASATDETIKYAIPTFTLGGRNLVHFAAFKNHIGFYPGPTGIKAFAKELSAYKNSKGAVQFPMDAPLPLALITKIVKFRIREEQERIKTTLKKKKTIHQ